MIVARQNSSCAKKLGFHCFLIQAVVFFKKYNTEAIEVQKLKTMFGHRKMPLYLYAME